MATHRSAPRAAAVCWLLLACMAADRVAGHGFLYKPESRNIQSYLYDGWETKEYTPQELFAGGVAHVSAGGAVWPEGKWGLCGDRWDASPQRWLAPRTVSATYVAGSTIDLHVTMTAEHWGRFSFRLCPTTDVSEDCFAQHVLVRADSQKPGNPFWYLASTGDGSSTTYSNPQFGGARTYVLKYKLPAGVTCANCVLQW